MLSQLGGTRWQDVGDTLIIHVRLSLGLCMREMHFSSWTSFAYLLHIDQAVSVIGSMHTFPSSLVHEGDASFLVGHL